MLLREGTTVDATLIAAPSSTKNREGARDPEMTQTRKGNQWYFGMKAHIGVDDQSGLVHTLIGTTAKTSDMSQFTELLHGEEVRISADRGYDYPHVHEHLQQHRVEDWVARKSKPGKGLDIWTQGLNQAIARMRAIGEHPFRILKRQFGFTKVRYRGLAKNTADVHPVCAGQPLSGQAAIIGIRGIIRPENEESPEKPVIPGKVRPFKALLIPKNACYRYLMNSRR